MKKFILKILLYSIIELVVVLFIILPILSNFVKPSYFNFFNNSICSNVKSGFILRNEKKYNESQIIIIGSSLSLNNLGAEMIEDSTKLSTFNVSSWGMRINEFEDFKIWDSNKIILSTISFVDLLGTDFIKKSGYPFTNNKAIETYNIVSDFNTYINQIFDVRKLLVSDSGPFPLKLDKCGSVLVHNTFNEKASKNVINVDKSSYTPLIDSFVMKLQKIEANHFRKHKLIIAFSPNARSSYSKEKSDLVRLLENKIKKSCPDVLFLNKYELNYPDSYFGDERHFNYLGAQQFTNEIIKDLVSLNIINTSNKYQY